MDDNPNGGAPAEPLALKLPVQLARAVLNRLIANGRQLCDQLHDHYEERWKDGTWDASGDTEEMRQRMQAWCDGIAPALGSIFPTKSELYWLNTLRGPDRYLRRNDDPKATGYLARCRAALDGLREIRDRDLIAYDAPPPTTNDAQPVATASAPIGQSADVRSGDGRSIMRTVFRVAFSQLADSFKQLATDAHKRWFQPLIRDVAYGQRQGGRLLREAIDAGSPGLRELADILRGWTYEDEDERNSLTWTWAVCVWLANKYPNRLPDNAANVDFVQWKLKPGMQYEFREWTGPDGTTHKEWKLPDGAFVADGSVFGQFQGDEQDAIERTYQRLRVYAAAAQLFAELVCDPNDERGSATNGSVVPAKQVGDKPSGAFSESKKRRLKRGRKAKLRRARKTEPTKTDEAIYVDYLQTQSYRKTGSNFGISHTRAREIVMFVEGCKNANRSKSVRTQALPTDERGQATELRRNRRSKPVGGDD